MVNEPSEWQTKVRELRAALEAADPDAVVSLTISPAEVAQLATGDPRLTIDVNVKTSDDQTPDVFRLRLTPSPAGAPDTKDGPNPSRDEYLRAAAAFYPFVGEYGLQINPEDVDEIVYAVLHHARSTRDLDEIEAAVREQIAEARDATDRLRELYATSISERPWIVWRQDDNGNRYVVSRHRTREQADKVASEFDARGHRQIYWVESAHRPVPATPGPPPPRPVPTHQR